MNTKLPPPGGSTTGGVVLGASVGTDTVAPVVKLVVGTGIVDEPSDGGGVTVEPSSGAAKG